MDILVSFEEWVVVVVKVRRIGVVGERRGLVLRRVLVARRVENILLWQRREGKRCQ